MKKISICLLFCLFPLFLTNSAIAGPMPPCPANSATITLMEQWSNGNADFTLYTSAYYVTDLAIGNNGAVSASISSGAGTLSGWTPATVTRANVSDLWSESWLNDISGFDNYTSVFLFSSGSSGVPLSTGTTDGFQGTGTPPSGSSPFAVRWYQDDNCIKGGTSTVPVPGAVWLMSSGLVALLAVRRQQKGHH